MNSTIRPLNTLNTNYTRSPRKMIDSCVKPCAKPCETACPKPCGKMNNGWNWIGAAFIAFIIFLVLFWLIFYSLKPTFVLDPNTGEVDTARVLLAAVIAAIILLIIVWLIKVAVSRSS